MGVRPRGLTALLWLVATVAGAQETSWTTWAEAGAFHKAYQDRQFVSPTSITLAVPQGSFGSEVEHRSADHSLFGATLAQTTVVPGSTFNFDRQESQALTVRTLGGGFVGYDSGWWELHLGVAALVQLRTFDGQSYRAAGGTLGPSQGEGIDWDRRESFALVTALVRVLPVDGLHLKLRVGRQVGSLFDSLFNVQALWPSDLGLVDASLSFSTPWGYLQSGDGVLRNNERLTLGWEPLAGPIRFGAQVGYLVRPVVAGTGDTEFFSRFSAGLRLTIVWPDS